ncbi:MAG: epoxyqueuosine reductase QueH, partial [Clostridia bacterium]|nr:epoxyqueuosine reductase QueH [Clostridia bacterium]
MEKINYQKKMEEQIATLDGGERLLLHSCCGPCSSYVLEVLASYFNVDVLYYNPNIYPESEYYKRLQEQIKIINNMPFKNPVSL